MPETTLSAGRLNQVVSLQDQVRPQDTNELSEVKEQWREIARPRAEVLSLASGGETILAGQVVPQGQYRVTIRWRPGVTERMRLEWKGKFLYVKNAYDPYGLRTQLVLDCASQG